MKITQSTPEKLVIVDFPWFLGGFCLIGSGGFLFQLVTALQREVYSSKEIWIDISGFALLAFCGLFTAKRIVFTFDLRLRQLTWSRRALLTGTKGTLSLSQISAVNLEVSTNQEGSGLLYRVTLTTNKGIFPLTHAYSHGKRGHRTIRDAIAQALHLPIQAAAFDTDDGGFNADLLALIARGQTIEAIKQIRMHRRCTLAEAKQIVDSLLARSG